MPAEAGDAAAGSGPGSKMPTASPRNAAARAQAAPMTPPPMTATSTARMRWRSHETRGYIPAYGPCTGLEGGHHVPEHHRVRHLRRAGVCGTQRLLRHPRRPFRACLVDPEARRDRLRSLFRAAGGQPEYRRQDTRHDQGPPGGRLAPFRLVFPNGLRRSPVTVGTGLAVPGQQLAGMDVHDPPAVRLLFADEGGAAGLGDVL